MKFFSRSKKEKGRTLHPDGVPSIAAAEQLGRIPSGDVSNADSPNINQPERSNQSSASTSDRVEKYGLFLLNPRDPQPDCAKTEEIYLLDIVALHGINGDAYKTWTHENGKFWLRDFVPKGLPGARVFSFGYPAEVFFSLGTGNIDTFARSLLVGLKRERRKEVGSPFT